MLDGFLKALKWFVIVVFIICGLAAFTIADAHESIRPVLPGILCFGVAFIMSFKWRDMPGKIIIISVVSVLAVGLATPYAPMLFYLLTGIDIFLNFFVLWVALVFLICVPLMTVVFIKFDD